MIWILKILFFFSDKCLGGHPVWTVEKSKIDLKTVSDGNFIIIKTHLKDIVQHKADWIS